MSVPSSITDINTNPASNFPQGTDITGDTVASLPRAIQAIFKQQLVKGSTLVVAASGILTVPVSEGYYSVQGTGFSVTGISQAFDGRKVLLRFTQAGLTLVNSPTFILPNNTNITTKAGDVFGFVQESSSTWICTGYSSYQTAQITNPSALEIGTNAVTPTPYIDFHSSNSVTDYDVRLITSGGTASSGQGTLNHICASLQHNGEQIDAFPAGTKIVFYQASAPTGWTKVAMSSNYVLITGTGGTAGGGGGASHNIVSGCTVVASHTHTVDPAAVSTSADAHNHTIADAYWAEQGGTGGASPSGRGSGATDFDNALYTRTVTSSYDSHGHIVNIPSTATSTNTNLDTWQPYYYTVIVASKN
jgi:hypothetical protein